MADASHARLARALHPITSRVRTDVTAIKLSDGSRWTDEPLTEVALVRHLTTGPARGVCPIREGESVTMLALLDYDSHGGETPWSEMVAVVTRHIDLLALEGYRAVPFRSSGGRGIHLYLLWDEPQDAYSVRQALSDVLAMDGFKNGAKGVAQKQVEVFPKQDEVGLGEYGNQFILPLAGKSVPLDPLFDLAPMEREGVTQVEWLVSEPVPRRERPVVDRSAYEAEADPIAKVRAALFAIPNDGGDDSPDYDHWRDLAFAVHEATGGSDEGRELFAEWSTQNPKFDGKFFEQRVWAYIKPADKRTSGITRGTLYRHATDHGWSDGAPIDAEGFDDVPEADMQRAVELVGAERQENARKKHEAKSRWRQAIMEAQDELTLQDDVCLKIAADHRLDHIGREMLAEALKQRFASLNVRLPIAACRELLRPARREKKAEQPDWLDGFVYVTSEDKFYRIDSEEFLTAQGFNAKFNRYLPPPDKGELPKSAHRVALDEVGIATVTRATYVPFLGPLFSVNGVECVNLYRPSSVPEAAKRLDAKAVAAMGLLERHVRLICGGRESVARTLLDWMAYNVQNPGRKIRWCPLIKGIEGDGKSLLAQIMTASMGRANVKQISPKVLGTDFTGWAHGACIGVFEELRLAGHNRHDIHNAIKPFITNDDVPIHRKGQDEFTAINTMNYIAFTNHSDALPLNDNDRRFLVVFSPFQSLSDLQAAVGDVGDYFTTLFDVIRGMQGEIRRWLLDWQISDEFEPEGRAPSTQEKTQMVDLGVGQEEDAIVAAIEQGGIGIGKEVLAVSYLRAAAAQIDPEVGQMHAASTTKILMKLGWTRLPKQMKWRGQVCRIWHRGLGSAPKNEVLQRLLDQTLSGLGGNAVDADVF